MSRISKIGELVKEILTRQPLARDDDYTLYAYVLNHYGISKDITFWDLRAKVKDGEVPSMESVGRARRKCQELYSGLRASSEVAKGRAEQVEVYEDFAAQNRI